MSFKFFHYSMCIDEFLRLNYDDLPFEIQTCIKNGVWDEEEYESRINHLEDEVYKLEETISDLKCELREAYKEVDGLKDKLSELENVQSGQR